jgi:hypothetical protein
MKMNDFEFEEQTLERRRRSESCSSREITERLNVAIATLDGLDRMLDHLVISMKEMVIEINRGEAEFSQKMLDQAIKLDKDEVL